MMPTYVILVAGYIKSGKDTIGDYLCKKHGFRRYAFADAIKDDVAQIHGFDRSLLDTHEGKDMIYYKGYLHRPSFWMRFLRYIGLAQSVRDLLIECAENMRRVDINYWVNKVISKIDNDGSSKVVVTDWRFPTEYSRFTETNYLIDTWRVSRPDILPTNCPTERSLDGFRTSITVHNTRLDDLTYLYSEIDKVIEHRFDFESRYSII